MEVITKSAKETKKLGNKYGVDLINENKSIILALSGDLGSGKTTFLQGFAKGLGVKRRIISPTFVLMRKYDSDNKRTFYHIDLYRLDVNVKGELANLGFEEIISDPNNVVAVEWAEKVKGYLPKRTIWFDFRYVSKDERKIQFKR